MIVGRAPSGHTNVISVGGSCPLKSTAMYFSETSAASARRAVAAASQVDRNHNVSSIGVDRALGVGLAGDQGGKQVNNA
jgi:hypothetical protein